MSSIITGFGYSTLASRSQHINSPRINGSAQRNSTSSFGSFWNGEGVRSFRSASSGTGSIHTGSHTQTNPSTGSSGSSIGSAGSLAYSRQSSFSHPHGSLSSGQNSTGFSYGPRSVNVVPRPGGGDPNFDTGSTGRFDYRVRSRESLFGDDKSRGRRGSNTPSGHSYAKKPGFSGVSVGLGLAAQTAGNVASTAMTSARQLEGTKDINKTALALPEQQLKYNPILLRNSIVPNRI